MADDHKGSGEQAEYLSYLLRLWCVDGGGQPVWRASLKSASSGEQVGFASVEELFDYLRAETEAKSRHWVASGVARDAPAPGGKEGTHGIST
jgi:hypothetical protein